MKRFIALFVCLLISAAAFADKITNFFGLNFGDSQEKCHRHLIDRGYLGIRPVDDIHSYRLNSVGRFKDSDYKYNWFDLSYVDNELYKLTVVINAPENSVESVISYISMFSDNYNLEDYKIAYLDDKKNFHWLYLKNDEQFISIYPREDPSVNVADFELTIINTIHSKQSAKDLFE